MFKLDQACLSFCHICIKDIYSIEASHKEGKYLLLELVPDFCNVKSWPL